MKKFSFILFLALLCSACSDNQMQDDLVTIDVTASYPEKKLVLQDFMDVEYIPLETTDDILCAGSVWAVSEHLILATNFNQDGNIFLFDRESGKALRKINHKGQSGEEYTSALGFILDEENNELYVSDTYGRKIFVYDLEGNFKRRLSWEDDFMFSEIFDFNQEYLIAHDELNENSTSPRSKQAFMLLSKQNGSITKTIQIPFKDKKSIIIRTPVDDSGMCYAYAPSTSHPVVPYFDDFMLAEYSSDGKLIRSIKTPSGVVSAQRLKDSLTLAGGLFGLIIYDGDGKEIWSMKSDAIAKQLGMQKPIVICGAKVLPNGNILCATYSDEGCPDILEISPADNKIVKSLDFPSYSHFSAIRILDDSQKPIDESAAK